METNVKAHFIAILILLLLIYLFIVVKIFYIEDTINEHSKIIYDFFIESES